MARTQGSKSQTTEPRIRAAAERLFAQSGFAAVSMRQIASEVGVQVGALYNYTPDKQALLFDLMRAHMDATLDAVPQHAERTDAVTRLEAFTRFHIRFHLDRPDAVFIAYMELRSLTEQNFQVIEALRRRYEGTLTDILRLGQVEGVFDIADLRVTTRALIAMLTGVTTWFRGAGALRAEEIEDLYWHMVRKAVTA